MTKKEAAEYIGVSEKSITTYVKDGKLSVRYEPGKTSPVAKFDAAEVAAFAAARNAEPSKREAGNVETVNSEAGNGEAATSEAATSEVGNVATVKDGSKKAAIVPTSNFKLPASGPVIQIEAAHLPELAQALYKNIVSETREVDIDKKLLLTIPEAMALSGLKEKPIRDAIKAGTLKSIRIGRSIQVRPADLNAWVDSQFGSGKMEGIL